MKRLDNEQIRRRPPSQPGTIATRNREAGLTLTELLVTIWMLAIVAVIVSNSALDAIERARLTRCMAEARSIQAAVWTDSNDGMGFVDPAKFWSSHYHSARPGPYCYLVDGDASSGTGTNLDGIDEESSGTGIPEGDDIRFVLMCEHDHTRLADYVYLTDHQTPRIVGGENGVADPGYDRFSNQEFDGPKSSNDENE